MKKWSYPGKISTLKVGCSCEKRSGYIFIERPIDSQIDIQIYIHINVDRWIEINRQTDLDRGIDRYTKNVKGGMEKKKE